MNHCRGWDCSKQPDMVQRNTPDWGQRWRPASSLQKRILQWARACEAKLKKRFYCRVKHWASRKRGTWGKNKTVICTYPHLHTRTDKTKEEIVTIRSRGDGWVSKAFVLQAWGPEFDPWNTHKRSGMVAWISIPVLWRQRQVGHLGLKAAQPNVARSQPAREILSQRAR